MLRSLKRAVLTLGLCLGAQLPAAANVLECTLVVDAVSGKELLRAGTCDQRVPPASTFKVPLAAIGYDSGILQSEHAPVWSWKPGIEAPKRDQKTVDPTIWEKDSVLWYSREITSRLGGERFATYVAKLGYGNADVGGDPGKDNGLTHSWLGASLEVSPEDQVGFLRGLLDGALPVSAEAQALTRAILPRFEGRGGWQVKGKTGSIWLRNKAGDYDRTRPVGWFVGWAGRNGSAVVFARLEIGSERATEPPGLAVRARFLKAFPDLP